MALDREGWLTHLKNAEHKSIEALCRRDKRKVQSWFAKPDELWTPSNNAKSCKVSRGMANKLDIIDLIDRDKKFASL